MGFNIKFTCCLEKFSILNLAKRWYLSFPKIDGVVKTSIYCVVCPDFFYEFIKIDGSQIIFLPLMAGLQFLP